MTKSYETKPPKRDNDAVLIFVIALGTLALVLAAAGIVWLIEYFCNC